MTTFKEAIADRDHELNEAARYALQAGRGHANEAGYSASWVNSTGVELVARRAVTLAIGLAEKSGAGVDYDGLMRVNREGYSVPKATRRRLIADICDVARMQVLDTFEDTGNRIYSKTEKAISRVAVGVVLQELSAQGIADKDIKSVLGDVDASDMEPPVPTASSIEELIERSEI